MCIRDSVDVEDKRLAKYSKGDRVHVEMTAKSGRNAVIIGFGLPLLLFVASLLAIHYAGTKDETAAFCAIGVLVVYYLIIYMARKSINRHFEIRLADCQ